MSTLTQQEIGRLTAKWRMLARMALDCVTPGALPQPLERLKADSHDALNWPSPLPGYQDAFVLFSLSRFAAAFAKCGYDTAKARAPVLKGLADLVLDMLGDTPEPPRLPFRADIDG